MPRYTQELKDEAVALYNTGRAGVVKTASEIGIATETLRSWSRQSEGAKTTPDLKVDTDAYAEQASCLEVALEDFRRYTNEFSRNSDTYLSKFNSNFKDELKKMLNDLGNTQSRRLFSEIQEYAQNLLIKSASTRELVCTAKAID